MLVPVEPRVVIVGAGFAGLAAARALRKAPVQVTLVDRQNHHLFQPLLYQVATAALAAPDIAAPVRKLLARQANTTILMGEVTRIDVEKKQVELDGGESALKYDYLLLATGMTHAYFGHDEWRAHAPGLKTLGEALDIRSRILAAFERAERESDPEKRREHTTFVVIGAGPTGVELAGALAEIAGRTLARDFRHYDPRQTRVVLVEGGDRILSTFTPDLSAKAEKSLRALGVEIRLGARVTGVDAHGVHIGRDHIRAGTVLWAAGVAASPLTKDLGAPLDRAGRVKVDESLRVPGHPEIFALGDLIARDQDGKPLPGVCQLGMQSGRYAADEIRRALRSEASKPFHYSDKGSMATIGRARAIADLGGRARFSGFFAWLLWLFIHILFLVDFRNRLVVLFEWAWAYLTWERSSRVILAAPERALAAEPARPSAVP
ncbi:MAG: NAD(P)/FAD-dependent oxidoreductase [Sandaracinus sp.]